MIDTLIDTAPTWMVKVVLALDGLGLLVGGQDPVEAVLADDGHLPLPVVHLVLTQQLHDLTAHRGLEEQPDQTGLYWFVTRVMLFFNTKKSRDEKSLDKRGAVLLPWLQPTALILQQPCVRFRHTHTHT